MNIKSIPIPAQMKHLPLDPRGYPIFFGALVGKDGSPYFTINDERRREAMIARDLCSICGKRLFKFRWFAGGPQSAFDERGVYIDMPMHDDCVHYALRVCPYLAAPRYIREVGVRQSEMARASDGTFIIEDPIMIPERPEVFVALLARGQTMIDGERAGQYVRPKRPYLRIEHWQHGKMLSKEEVSSLPSHLQGIGMVKEKSSWR